MSKTRTNRNNDGRSFERLMESIFVQYERQGIATIEKVSPPARITGPGRRVHTKEVLFLANPWLDFVGVWTARGGQALMLEAKDHRGARLKLACDGGIRVKQIESMERWSRSGAAVCVVWHNAGRAAIISLTEIKAALVDGKKSLEFIKCQRIPTGKGFVFHDILAALKTIYPEK